jgi:nucleoside-diphosphate kinase
MSGNITFTIIKPCAVKNQYIGGILKLIADDGFRIAAMKLTKMSRIQAAKFYEIHRERPFYNDLTDFMSSGPIIVAMLEKENAVDEFRRLIGNTDPAKADPGTIRKLFAENIQRNAIHGSDSDENAVRESGFFFPETERFGIDGGFLEKTLS